MIDLKWINRILAASLVIMVLAALPLFASDVQPATKVALNQQTQTTQIR